MKVVNRLTSKLLSLPLKEFFHLSKLLPFLFESSFTNGCREFCRFSILTINFENTVHLDRNDRIGDEADNICLEALSSLLQCQELTEPLTLQVKTSIDHIKAFGLSSPTTCGYQIASDNSEVEPVQFFIAYGLGICYRIFDGWTHSFLAATHGHMTSATLYIFEGRVYSSFPNINILAWGKGGDGT